MSGEVLLAREGEIATLTLSSPERLNALSLAMWEQLGAHAKKLGKDASLRCVVIRGAGDRAFAAGADIAAFKDERANSKQARKYGERIAGGGWRDAMICRREIHKKILEEWICSEF